MILPKEGLLKTDKQKLIDAEFKIGELERQKKWLSDRVAYLLVGIQALGRKLNYSPEEAKKCIEDFIVEREVQENERVKNEFKEKLAKGEITGDDFKIVDKTKE